MWTNTSEATRKIKGFGVHLEERDQLVADELVVDSTLPGDLEHVRGNIDPGQRSGERTKQRSDKTRATTQVQNVQIARWRKAYHRIKQQARSPISQFADQVLIKVVGIAIKESDDVLLWRRDRGGLGTEGRQGVLNDFSVAPCCRAWRYAAMASSDRFSPRRASPRPNQAPANSGFIVSALS
jgi:hypothetical protein